MGLLDGVVEVDGDILEDFIDRNYELDNFLYDDEELNQDVVMTIIEDPWDTERDLFLDEMYTAFAKDDDNIVIDQTLMKILLLSFLITAIFLILVVTTAGCYVKQSRRNEKDYEKGEEKKTEVLTFVLSRPTTVMLENVDLNE